MNKISKWMGALFAIVMAAMLSVQGNSLALYQTNEVVNFQTHKTGVTQDEDSVYRVKQDKVCRDKKIDPEREVVWQKKNIYYADKSSQQKLMTHETQVFLIKNEEDDKAEAEGHPDDGSWTVFLRRKATMGSYPVDFFATKEGLVEPKNSSIHFGHQITYIPPKSLDKCPQD
ncbi:hypothetical protein M595_3320 [Lyngbya aestuarii BL J]|uniref:Uncharacterized protein n=1 Tax=Lyngbya aestuarii BL J TaxID=1348334 RepID=U7QFK9_9CYAN|nr:hypothetical protein [Lyngbya aestuarii]ERT06688.1 hypothetical protein M595_3320 [Lyngbya aestuarii BL J]